MKVLFATYPMAFHTPGGGEIQLLAYAKHLPQHGVEVSLFDPWKPHFLDHDVVHFFSCVGGSSHFCAFIKSLGLPLVVSSSLWITEETRHLYPVDEIRAQLGLADRVVTNSEIECDSLARVLNLPREKFVTVYNGVDDVFFDRLDPELFRQHIGTNTPFVLNVGNIEPRKNQLRLAQAMKSHPDQKLLLVGHVRDENYFQEVMREAGSQATYIGPLPHDSELLRSAYQACSLFCLPSTLETPGLAALEAAAQGVPLLVTSEGSTREYFGDCAGYVDPNDSNDIAQHIAQALLNTSAGSDRERQRAASAVGREYSWATTTVRLPQIYNTVVK
ncbi:glycosyltransferase family 4 protein [Paraburkholderia sp. SIMBA_053]|uniref:glycosyltransferase family 4 protein n=1 Tax=Paraburkholderia sp. SIMBA_053 TaxID=3085794 RepID=UPI00397938E6